MRSIYILISCALWSLSVWGSNPEIDSVLRSIEINNTSLKALRKAADARISSNNAEVGFDDPEIEVGHLWGKPQQIGSMQTINAVQWFDLPTITGLKGDLASKQNSVVELNYLSQRLNILLDAKKLCIEIIYTNAFINELDKRLQFAQDLAIGYKKRFDQGDINILEYNKSQINLANSKIEKEKVEIEKERLLSELKKFNGGLDINIVSSENSTQSLPLTFEEFYLSMVEKSPNLSKAKKEIEVGRSRLKNSKAMNLPEISVGYAMENVIGEHFQGITLGVSIPLWKNSERVNEAKALLSESEANAVDLKEKYYYTMSSQFNQAKSLRQTALEYRKALTDYSNTNLLEKALKLGEISIMDYMVELQFYYDMLEKALKSERDYELILAELTSVEL